jgi:selenocysteine lyase/cysteine desulfurase
MLNRHWNDEFPVNQECLYLNHAAVAPWPVRAQQAVTRFASENTALGASHYPEWLQIETQLRRRLEALINAPQGSIALVKNTSEALSFVANGIHWQADDVVVISNQEFPSNRIVWQALSERGVKVIEVGLPWHEPEAELLEAIAQKPRLVSISAVQYASGLVLDIARIGAACRQHNVLFCVDAIQAIGAMPVAVDEWQCDFAMADGHKWMLGPEGLGLFYVRPETMEQLQVSEYGWHMIQNPGDFDQHDWQLAHDARRFECGSPNMLGAVALNESIGLLLDVGLATVRDAIHERCFALMELLNSMNAQLLNPILQQRPSGIITFHLWQTDLERLYRTLMKNGVICAYRGGGIRFSPHFHTPLSVLEEACEAILAIET